MFDLARDLPAVVGDPIQIEQVMLNLVRNGLEAMDEAPDRKGGRQLRIRTKRHGDDYIQVSVQDRGKGVGENDLEKIFEPFFTTKPEGLGMGLAISRSIIQAPADASGHRRIRTRAAPFISPCPPVGWGRP